MTFLRALTLATHCVCVGRLGQINIYSWFILWHQLTLNKRVAPLLRLFEDSYLWSLWNTLPNTSRVVLAHIEVRLWHVWWTTTVRRKVKEFHWRAIATCWDVIHIIIYMGEPTKATEIAWEQNSQELIGTHTSSTRTWVYGARQTVLPAKGGQRVLQALSNRQLCLSIPTLRGWVDPGSCGHGTWNDCSLEWL